MLIAAAAFPGRIAAATVDHSLRPESADEARYVAALCAERAMPHAILTLATPISGSIQASARAARYALLEQWCRAEGINWLMTAHHADDQLETMVMRINRSSGVGGMAGIRARQGHILRPLLEWRRDDLADVVQAQGIVPVDDPSNRDVRYDRARIRPVVQACTLVDPVAANAVARNLSEADAALEWTAARLAADRLSHDGSTATLDTTDLPPELLRRLLLRALAAVTDPPLAPRGQQLTATIQALARGEQAMLGSVLIKPDHREPSIWRFRRAPPQRPR